ncbi:hypothetical protein BX661DRAFT_186275 [Kickxella alabastrina]|uniref:uncharacterized protein n=1 Tax=Kickxella alabastrina TaxID=61397 RepID=UPI00222111D5|nr:uncharacterized protein BX661DRAFT_186275 [Kickxella alabastrina]KAI7823706.1 hypothetical protein BX661DRAFT_186275 [Kickxella alabastrina]KAJ1945396.1 E1 ubiquitin-activating protein uba2 [Kickxella alabastrina]
MRTNSQISALFGPGAATRLATARVLVVGAGGIGCELLKNLSVSGFHHIHAIDLDTIDLSNLNRQFLFQRKHIKKPKAHVATAAIKAFNPSLDTSAMQANIKDEQFDVDWFGQFALVFNALDNLEARRHVNAMCLAARVPLVESGTAGYLGQVTVIKGGETECFDCHPKPAEKRSFPVCTIRSTPTAPIHCIVWAKNYLFVQLFGEPPEEEKEVVEEVEAGQEEELKALKEESGALAALSEAMGGDDFAQRIFNKVFCHDIRRLLSMSDMWAQRQPPRVLDYDELEHQVCDPPADHSNLSMAQAFILFRESCHTLARRRLEGSPLAFDKDDQDTLDFVTATASLRSYAFFIDQKSPFEVKAMAGNIIPAIATTNAIVAGMMVTQGVLALAGRLDECHTAYLSYNTKRPRCIIRETLSKPSLLCPVCHRRYLTLRLADPAKTMLGDLLDYIGCLEGDMSLGMSRDNISVVEGSRLLYDPDYDSNCSKSMQDLCLVPGKMVTFANEDDSDVVPVILSIARPLTKENGGLDILIEGFEYIPEFVPLSQQSLKEECSATAVGNNSIEFGKRSIDDVNEVFESPSKKHAFDSEDLVILD